MWKVSLKPCQMIFSKDPNGTTIYANIQELKLPRKLSQKWLSCDEEDSWIKKRDKWGWIKRCSPVCMRWNSPYCEEVGETGKVRELGWSGGVFPTALCLHFTGTIPECHLLISRLPWQWISWQLASLLPVPPFQDWQWWIWGAETLPVSKISSNRLSPIDLFTIFKIWYTIDSFYLNTPPAHGERGGGKHPSIHPSIINYHVSSLVLWCAEADKRQVHHEKDASSSQGWHSKTNKKIILFFVF